MRERRLPRRCPQSRPNTTPSRRECPKYEPYRLLVVAKSSSTYPSRPSVQVVIRYGHRGDPGASSCLPLPQPRPTKLTVRLAQCDFASLTSPLTYIKTACSLNHLSTPTLASPLHRRFALSPIKRCRRRKLDRR